MIIKDLTVGPIMANCYIVGCEETKAAAVIDPGDEADRILMVLAEAGLTVKTIINTHGHFDHVGANQRMKEVTGAELLIHSLDAPMLSQLSATAASWGMTSDNSPAPDRMLADGEERRLHALVGQRLEHGRRIAEPRTVVEGEHHFAGPQEVILLEVLEAKTGATGGVDFHDPLHAFQPQCATGRFQRSTPLKASRAARNHRSGISPPIEAGASSTM